MRLPQLERYNSRLGRTAVVLPTVIRIFEHILPRAPTQFADDRERHQQVRVRGHKALGQGHGEPRKHGQRGVRTDVFDGNDENAADEVDRAEAPQCKRGGARSLCVTTPH